jgi:hypothetical protein
MNRTRLFCILMAFLQLSAFSQTNYKKGTVVTMNGDSLKGYINCREWNSNPAQFTFRSALDNDSVQKRDLINTRSFLVEGIGIYEQFIVSVSLDAVDRRFLSNIWIQPGQLKLFF